jgi:hypothetical protein
MFWIAVRMRKTMILTRTKMLEVRERGHVEVGDTLIRT